MTAAKRTRRAARRRIATLAATAMLTTGVAAGTGPGSASAAPVEITDAVFEWGLSALVQGPAYFGGCEYLSAGASAGDEATYKATEGNVTIVKDGVTPTYAGRCANAATGLNQKVRWTGGTGTADPAAGTASLSFTGSFSINFYGGLVPFTLSDVTVTIDAGGTGTVKADLGGYASDMDNPFVKAPITTPFPDVVIANLSGVDVGAGGFTSTPVYQGVTFDVPSGSTASPQNRANPGWGSWPVGLVEFHFATGLTSYWYSSGTNDAKKPPTAITLSWGNGNANGNGNGNGTGNGNGAPIPTPGEGEQVVSVVVQDRTGPGEFGWTIEGDGVVSLGTAADYGTFLYATGNLDPITVVDTRDGGPEWSVSGQVGNFNGGVPGSYLGWSPLVVQAGAGALAGAPVASGFGGGAGLSTPSLLAAAADGHVSGTAKLSAALDLRLPIETAAGTYSAVLTITALS